MLDELKSLRTHISNDYRKPQVLPVYSRFSTKKVPAAHPWVAEVRDNRRLQDFIEDLGTTLKSLGLQSLTGPQVNAPLQIVAIMRDAKPFVFLNPTAVSVGPPSHEEKIETSISFPWVRVKIARPTEAKVSYLNRSGEIVEETLYGAEAGALCQGLENLAGGSILDHLPAVLRATAIRKAKLLMRKYENSLKTSRGKNKTPPKAARK